MPRRLKPRMSAYCNYRHSIGASPVIVLLGPRAVEYGQIYGTYIRAIEKPHYSALALFDQIFLTKHKPSHCRELPSHAELTFWKPTDATPSKYFTGNYVHVANFPIAVYTLLYLVVLGVN